MGPVRDMSLPPRSAIPMFYYAMFGIYEPLMVVGGLVGAIMDPVRTHNAQAPWPVYSPPPPELPAASIVTVIQLAHVCSLIGLVNYLVLTAVRRHLSTQLAVQEKIVRALLTPLLIGDVLHIVLTLWALGDTRWDFARWTGMLWATVVLGLGLLAPRLAWHMGVGRYVHERDGRLL
ncbi:hypothetical protein OF83DRAFT_1103633 [Amylostereum chailletii]|nr:hypothetical protein OF83DRAFT_1103633 [Amylostereum chailletii]